MSGRPSELVYWDAGIFLAWMMEEQRPDPADLEGIAEQAGQFADGKLQLITSVITLTEILESKLPFGARETFEKLFQRRNCHLVNVDRSIAGIAHDIRDFYSKRNDGLPTVTTPDALHLATAIASKCDKFYTFDGADVKRSDKPKRSRLLLSLNGVIAGQYTLVIAKPRPSL